MNVAAGARLGPYEVLGPLGAGGMGEVFRARDTRLGRDAAVKVLAEEYAQNRAWLARFEQEARSASALNHPNIVTVYEIGEADATRYIAMELVDGKSLRELVGGGPLPLRKTLSIAAQVAEGLAAAHTRGIVHRDLKPENVMVTRDGPVKLLDFGLAKLTAPLGGPEEATISWEKLHTRPGSVLGTVGYMSPEQARGESVDFRSDQFSFGSMLYEMATGKRAFHRATAVETLSAILRDEPEPMGALEPRTPTPLRWIVERCLAKDPEERYASTRDLARDLETVRHHLSEVSSGDLLATAPSHGRTNRALIAGTLAVAAALGAGYWGGRRKPRTLPVFHRLTFDRGLVGSAGFSPDGKTIVYGARWQDRAGELFAVRPESPVSRPLGLVDWPLESISSSGDVAVLKGGKLGVVPLLGGTPREIADNVTDAGWGPDGKSLAVIRCPDGKCRLEFPIGKVVYEAPGDISHATPLPEGGLLAFLEHPVRSDTRGWVSVLTPDGTKRRLGEEFNAISGLAWNPRLNELCFGGMRAGEGMAVYAVTLSGRQRLLLRGAGDLVLRDVDGEGRALVVHGSGFHREAFGLAPGETRERDLSWLDGALPVDLSDDGKTLLFSEQGSAGKSQTYDVCLRTTDGAPAVRLGEGSPQALSPDGSWALTMVLQPLPPQLALLPTGAGEAKRLTADAVNHVAARWLPDGKRVVFEGIEPGHGSRLYVQDVSGGPPRSVTTEDVHLLRSARPCSPDGTLVFARGPGRTIALYPLAGGEPRSIPGLGGATPIRWSGDGRSLFLRESIPGAAATRVSRLDLGSGRRELVRELAAADPAGVPPGGIGNVLITPDGTSYVYGYARTLNDLYLVDGLE